MISYQGRIDTGSDRDTYNAAYWASRDPRIGALQQLPPVERYNAAYELAKKGLLIDEEIDARAQDPWLITFLRLYVDQTPWIPSAMQPNIQSSGLLPGEQPNKPFVPYDPTFNNGRGPDGALVVTFDLKDPALKPFPKPAAPAADKPAPASTTPKPEDVLVGPAKTPTLNDLTQLARTYDLPDGFTRTEGGQSYILHIYSFGARMFERLS